MFNVDEIDTYSPLSPSLPFSLSLSLGTTLIGSAWDRPFACQKIQMIWTTAAATTTTTSATTTASI